MNADLETVVASESGETRHDDPALEEMAKAGVLYGHRKSKTNPKMERYIFTTRNGIQILDLLQTIALVARAGEVLHDVVSRGGTVLCVGTTPASKDLVSNFAAQFSFPFVTNRWLGGTLTNFPTISKRIRRFTSLRADRDSGKLQKYTKKERLDFSKEIERLELLFSGLESLNQLPDALFVVDPVSHMTAMREANRLAIPVIAIASSNANPDMVRHIIPANDRAKASIAWVLGKLAPAVEAGKRAYVANRAAPMPASPLPPAGDSTPQVKGTGEHEQAVGGIETHG